MTARDDTDTPSLDSSSSAASSAPRPGSVLTTALFVAVFGGVLTLFGLVLTGMTHNNLSTAGMDPLFYVGAVMLIIASALALWSIVSLRRQVHPGARPWWIVVAYALCVVAGCIGLWGVSMPLLNRIP